MPRAIWRRSFWRAPTINRFGAAFDQLHRDPDRVMNAPPLVLGLAMNYAADQIAPFVLSLRASGYSGQIVLLIANLGEDTQRFLRSHSVELIPFAPERYAPYHVQNARWFVYLEYLLGRLLSGSFPTSVFLTDVRDVVFQADPFAAPHGDIDVFLENAEPLLGTCPVNARWIRTCFGEHALAEIAAQPIACSGTVLASGRGALSLALEMWDAMTAFTDEAARAISDQAAHNVIAHRGLVDGLRIHPNGGRVLTLHYVGRDSIQIGPNGMVSGPGGVVSPILHQYDRHPMLKDYIAARYASFSHPAATA